MDSSMGTDFRFFSDADFPNKVKLRKKLPLWLLEITLGIDHDRHRHTLKPTCTVKDKYLKGVFDVDIGEKRIEYRKICGIPFIGQLVLNAGLNYRNPFNRPKIGLSFSTSGAAAVVVGDVTTFDQRISLGKRVGLEFLGEIRRSGYTTGLYANQVQVDDGPINVHLKEVNAIIKI